MGTSVDYGVCKGGRADGMACTMVINKYESIWLSCYFDMMAFEITIGFLFNCLKSEPSPSVGIHKKSDDRSFLLTDLTYTTPFIEYSWFKFVLCSFALVSAFYICFGAASLQDTFEGKDYEVLCRKWTLKWVNQYFRFLLSTLT